MINDNYQELLQEIDSHIFKNRYSKHSFVKNLTAGNFSISGLKNWAVQKYHQTFMQNCIFSAIHSRAIPYEDIRQFQMMQLIAEETAIADGTDSHYNLMKRFAVSLGASSEEINISQPGEAVVNYINYIVPLCSRMHPVYGMLAVYTIESQSAESVNQMYNKIKQQLNLSDYDLEWFLIHGKIEDEHAGGAKKLILKYAPTLADFSQVSWRVVNDTLHIWKQLQNFYADLITLRN